MADHRAEQVMAAVATTLTGLTTTGANAFRDRIRDLQESELPALVIMQGSDSPTGERGMQSFNYIDSELTISIQCVVKQLTGITTTLNQIRKEVHVAMMADITKGLSFVHNTYPSGGASQPELSGDGNQPTGVITINYIVHYRSVYTDPSA